MWSCLLGIGIQHSSLLSPAITLTMQSSLSCLLLLFLPNHVCISGSRQSSGAVDGHKHCLLMDEVDGMAGNEDRGGLQVHSCLLFVTVSV